MADISLDEVIIGMGNPNHMHVHRHNQLHLSPQNIDRLSIENNAGGILANTLNSVAAQSGGLSVNPQGYVSIEDTYNMRRGLCMMRFTVENNALQTIELSVLGYLAGGEARYDGVDGDTKFIPVRSWSVNTENVPDLSGLPSHKSVVQTSIQFLMGDPHHAKNLRSVRPVDIGQEVLGYLATEADGVQSGYNGNVAADLNKSVVVSKTQNLDPTHHAKELIKIASNVLAGNDYGSKIQDTVADSLYSNTMNETGLTENEFFKAMSISLGMWNYVGFEGFTLNEIAGVFNNFTDVMNLTLLDPNAYPEINNVALSQEYGSSGIRESTAQEIAFLTVDLLIRCGLVFLVFGATNNPHEFGGLASDDGCEILVGEFGSVLRYDDNAINRVERFKQELKTRFFSKYNTGYAHNSTVINISVKCNLFGETSVEVFFNGDQSQTQTYTNATYYIARSSSNISGTDVGIGESVSFLNNLREYFIKQ